jgi:hypothetical protein
MVVVVAGLLTGWAGSALAASESLDLSLEPVKYRDFSVEHVTEDFTPTITGDLTRVVIYCYNNASTESSATIRIVIGGSTATGECPPTVEPAMAHPNAMPFADLVLSPPVSVVAGSEYRMRIYGDGHDLYIASADENLCCQGLNVADLPIVQIRNWAFQSYIVAAPAATSVDPTPTSASLPPTTVAGVESSSGNAVSIWLLPLGALGMLVSLLAIRRRRATFRR